MRAIHRRRGGETAAVAAGALLRTESLKRSGLTLTSAEEYELIFTSARPD